MSPSDSVLVVPLSGTREPRAGWYGPATAYVEEVWLPVVGPASFLLWRRLAHQLEEAAHGLTTSLVELSAAIGLGSPRGSQAGIARSLRRLQRFGLAWRPVESVLVVRCSLPVVSAAQLARLHPTVQRRHRELGRGGVSGPSHGRNGSDFERQQDR
jgi:hypothetical protein